MTRKFDSVGRICIPKSLRDQLGWDTSTNILTTATTEGVLLTADTKRCVVCKNTTTAELVEYENITLCTHCIKNLLGRIK